MEMFCYQCEQTAKGQGCDNSGVCGKNPQVAALQDLLTYAVKGLSEVIQVARQKGRRCGGGRPVCVPGPVLNPDQRQL